MLYVIGCYICTGILMIWGCVGLYDRGWKWLGLAIVVLGLIFDVFGTFILGAPWMRKNEDNCYESKTYRGFPCHNQKSVTQNLTIKSLTNT
jgi:hypothetical protein